MRVAQLSKSRRTRVSRSTTIVAPIAGSNTNDSQFSIRADESPDLIQNFFPRFGYLDSRGGSTSYSTGITGNVKTLATYSAANGTESLFAATPSGIYNVTASGAVGAAVIARTDGKHQWTMFGDGTNNWICMFNGVDKPAFYNGTTWTAVDGVSVPAITGVTTTGLIGACSYQGRLFLIEKDKLKFWYLPAGAVGGAAVAFDLAAQCSRGGYLMAALPFTYDGGSGMDDVIVFVTSMGEAICYKGTDPGTAANWIKLGTYYIGKPIGRRCMAKLGGDVLVLTENGIVKMSAALNGVVDDRSFYITNKIRDSFNFQYRSNGSVFGWEMLVFHKEQALIVNIPSVEDSSSSQFVMNINNGAWCFFSGWSANTFGVLNGTLYYARTTTTYSAWGTTLTDEGQNIQAQFRTSNVNIGANGKSKLKFCSVNHDSPAAGMYRQATLYVDGLATSSTCVLPTSTAGFTDYPFTLFSNTGKYHSILFSINLSNNASGIKVYSFTFTYESGGLI